MSELRNRKQTVNQDASAAAENRKSEAVEANSQKSPKIADSQTSLPAWLVLQYLVILRVINALTINTFFQPDEYFQALEPAHFLQFGYGELTWEWKQRLRSFNYPWIFYLTYKVSDLLGLKDFGVLVLPKIAQALVSAVSEYHLYKFAQRVFQTRADGEKLARIVLLLSMVSSFNWFCFTRTFSNTFELNMTIIALRYWPWPNAGHASFCYKQLFASLFFAAVAVIVRPTNVLIWIVLGPHLLYKHSCDPKIVAVAAAAGGLVFALNVWSDYVFYGEFVLPMWNFFQFNVIKSFADFYGTNAWHFHVTQSLPFVLTTYLPFFVHGVYISQFSVKRLFLITIAVSITVLSFISHKEFRFIYHLMPFFLVFTSFSVSAVWNSKRFIIYTIVALNMALGVFLTQFQERGVIDVINSLKENPEVDSIGFLTPCHSTPLHSYLHRHDLANNVWYLTCEPPSLDANINTYMDESDKFYKDPKSYMEINFPPTNKKFRGKLQRYNYEWPTHLVIFEALEPVMKSYLQNSKYEECGRLFNSYFHWDSRREGDVIVYCKWPWE